MKSRNILIASIAIIGAILFVTIENDILKGISTILSSIALIYNICAHIFRNEDKFINLVENLRQKNWLFKILLKEPEKKQFLRNSELLKTKEKIIESNAEQITNLNGTIFSSQGLTKVFMLIDSREVPSHKLKNNISNWRDSSQKQFTIITGKSGCGKSFELRERFIVYQEQLQKKIQTVKSEWANDEVVKSENKIPIYIELKSLKEKLSKDWIKEEIKSAVARLNNKQKLNDKYISFIIDNNEVVYFFDALDEVDSAYRDQTMAEIIKLSKETTVFFTCRTEVYEELKFKRNKYSDYKEDELVPPYLEPLEIKLLPLSKELITDIIENYKPTENRNNNHDGENTEAVIAQKQKMIKYVNECTPKFKEQLSTSIFLNLFISVFPKLTEIELQKLISGNEEDNLNLLWSRYEDIEEAIYQESSEGSKDSEDSKALKSYTVWIAKIVDKASFSAESIQPSWLQKVLEDRKTTVESKWQQKNYYLITRIIAAIIIGIGLGCIISTTVFLLLSMSVNHDLKNQLNTPLL